jgi:hypothetical protein
VFTDPTTPGSTTFLKMKNFFLILTISTIFQVKCDVNTLDESCPFEGCPSYPIDRDLLKFEQEDPELILAISQNQLIPPPNPKKELFLNISEPFWHVYPHLQAQYGQPLVIQELFYGKLFD